MSALKLYVDSQYASPWAMSYYQEMRLQPPQKLFAVTDSLLAAGNKHLFGDWCIADTEVALMLKRLLMHGDAVPAHLEVYANEQWQRPSVQLWVNKQRPELA